MSEEMAMMNRVGLSVWMTRIFALLREIGPYAAIELILPGGSLIALLLWLYRRDGGLMKSPARARMADLRPGSGASANGNRHNSRPPWVAL
jgi:hypothetical protein